MKVIQISSYGAAEVLQYVDRPMPVAQKGEVLIKVAAAGINRPDILQRKGFYAAPAGASELPGLEVSGEIIHGDLLSPDNIFNLKVGDKICALLQGGGYAEYCTAPIAQCLRVPQGLTMIEAAALPETFFTVWSNVFDRAKLGRTESGEPETLLVQGGSSGIGTTAIQMATALGHRVWATAGSEAKCRACEQLGAERAIHYKKEDFVEIIQTLSHQRGVDVILDMVGGDYLPREIACLAEDGRLALIAFLGGKHATLDISLIQKKRLSIIGSALRTRGIGFKAQIAQNLKQHIWPLIEAGHIRSCIDKVFELKEAAEAHKYMENGQHIGKLVLTC